MLTAGRGTRFLALIAMHGSGKHVKGTVNLFLTGKGSLCSTFTRKHVKNIMF
jgi:hypothetical protein